VSNSVVVYIFTATNPVSNLQSNHVRAPTSRWQAGMYARACVLHVATTNKLRIWPKSAHDERVHGDKLPAPSLSACKLFLSRILLIGEALRGYAKIETLLNITSYASTFLQTGRNLFEQVRKQSSQKSFHNRIKMECITATAQYSCRESSRSCR
jgi:hypothetical protein